MNEGFPIIDAILTIPAEGRLGVVGICTNTTAPGQVLNELEEKNRINTSVLGPLIVNRDGVERMIINSLAHPTMKYLILFSEESETFAPSTNLLQVLLNGIDPEKKGNYIMNGIARSPHYPNINKDIINLFREDIIVLPIFTHKNKGSGKILNSYLQWLKPKISLELYEALRGVNEKKKIYYDSLNEMIEIISKLPKKKKVATKLNPKDFQHLQPPKIRVKQFKDLFKVPFKVARDNKQVRLDIKIGNKIYFISSDDVFLLSYSLMKFLKEKKNLLSPMEQLLLGAELGRISTEIINDTPFKLFVQKNTLVGKEKIPLESQVKMITDKKFYYRVNTRDNNISVTCLAFDVCKEVFELISPSLTPLLKYLADSNQFENYEMDILHRIDIGTQAARANIAAKNNYSFIQDFDLIFKINKDSLPSIIIDGDNFLDVHKGILQKIYIRGITEEHGDVWKGLSRTASVLTIYRKVSSSLKKMPILYKQGEYSTEAMREEYKRQLLRYDHDGSYSYGERTRSYFGFDQLKETIKILNQNKKKATIIQRFDPINDMTISVDPDTKKEKFTHDPCLTHDIFFIKNNTLYSFHIVRAHNIVNAYPENIFGLHDAYFSSIQNGLGLKSGDMYVLSNRANILLLTEEQRTKKILSEPSKPVGEIDKSSGPIKLNDNILDLDNNSGVAYFIKEAQKIDKRPESKILDRLENYEGINIIEKAITYLEKKGVMHNNPILTEYYAGKTNPQSDLLAFFQANVFGHKVYGTAVFMNHSLSQIKEDEQICNYLLTKYSKRLKYPLGEIAIYYINYQK